MPIAGAVLTMRYLCVIFTFEGRRRGREERREKKRYHSKTHLTLPVTTRVRIVVLNRPMF
jgi:hypothetical protein